MDYTTITKNQLKEIKKLKDILREKKKLPVITTTLPNGTQYVTYITKDVNIFWEDLIKIYGEEWVRVFNQTLVGFGMAIPWYKKHKAWQGACPFCRIDPDMIDFCLIQRAAQIKDKRRVIIVSTVASSLGGCIISELVKFLFGLLRI